VKIEFADQISKFRHWWLVIRNGEVDVCLKDPGYEVNLTICSDLETLTAVWIGDTTIMKAIREKNKEAIPIPYLFCLYVRPGMVYKQTTHHISMRAGNLPDVRRASVKEHAMGTQSQGNTVHDYNFTNYVNTDPLPRDQTQSTRLHEPAFMVNSIDPITGRDLGDVAGHPYLVDGNVTMYFESEATRQEYLDTPIDHPFHLVDNPTDEGYDEG
jgi:hypothetical protein